MTDQQHTSDHRTRSNRPTPADIASTVSPRVTPVGPAWTEELDTTTRARLAEIASTSRTSGTSGTTRPQNGVRGNPGA